METILSAGKTAPPFKLESSTGKAISLEDFRGKRRVVLYFYPKADTPGCTIEACAFRDAIGHYEKADVAVLGISPDPVLDVTKFAEKFKLTFPLLADADHRIAEAYGVWQKKNMMGREYMGVVRTTFIIGADGKVQRVFEKVKPPGHEQEVLQALGG